MDQRLLLLILLLGHVGNAWPTKPCVVSDVLDDAVEGVQVLFKGPALEAFERRLPEAVESTLFDRFEGLLNQTQEFHADGNNDYVPEGRPFVVAILGGRVTGVLGTVADDAGRIFTQFMQPDAPPMDAIQLKKPCRRHKRLATVVQKYGHMYYHFLQEVLPRVIMLRQFLDADTKLLTFGSDHEQQWLEALGIPREQIEIYSPDELYCADELLVPTLSPVGAPPRENFELLRSAFGASERVPASQRDAVVYCSRANAEERHVVDEDELLRSIQSEFPSAEVIPYRGDEGAAATVALFRRAKAVIGMHGACLSHAAFSDADVAVVELLFLTSPPLMFWHAAAAIGQRYVIVPLAQSWWLQHDVPVSVQDVLDAMYLALDAEPTSDCEAGAFFWEPTGQCLPCAAGTYRAAGAEQCMVCPPGRIASEQGAEFCMTCPAGTFSSDGFACEPCQPSTSTLFPGASAREQCKPLSGLKHQLDSMFDEDVLVKKLVSMPGLEVPQPHTMIGRILQALSPWAAAGERERMAQRRRYLTELFVPSNSDHDGEGAAPHERHAGMSYGHRRMLDELTRATEGTQTQMQKDVMRLIRGALSRQ